MRFRWTLVVIVCAFVNGSCRKDARTETTAGLSPPQSSEIPLVTASIELSGPGFLEPKVFAYQQLADMAMTRIENVLMRKSHEDDELTSWQGPALTLLLEQAGLKTGPMDVTVEAKDGYVMEVDLADLDDAIVAMKTGDGRWLAEVDEDCPLKLIPPHKPGNFWVMNPVRIIATPAAGDGSSE